jgi:NADH-quinone oxidoreductase subunit K
MTGPAHYVLLSGILFTIGIVVVATRRQPLIALMGIELMLQGANLALVALTSWLQDWGGEAAVFVVMAIAAAELAVGLGVVLAYGQQQAKR